MELVVFFTGEHFRSKNELILRSFWIIARLLDVGDHFEKDHTQTVNVRTLLVIMAVDNFRCQVEPLPNKHLIIFRLPVLLDQDWCLTAQFQFSILVEKNVCRTEVPVDKALTVNLFQGHY